MVDGAPGKANETEEDNYCGTQGKRLPYPLEWLLVEHPTPDEEDVLKSVYVPSPIHVFALLYRPVGS